MMTTTFKNKFEQKLLEFARPMLRELDDLEMMPDISLIDHACYRVASVEAYQIIKGNLEQHATLLSEALINGRPIATYKLAQPLAIAPGYVLDVIEIPAPKAGRNYQEGFEHLEAVTKIPLKQFMVLYPNIQFDCSNLTALVNRDVSCILKSGHIKFHERSLEEIIRDELRIRTEQTIKKVKITIKSPAGAQTLETRTGLGFQAICANHQTPIEFDCRKADCGICAFRVLEGSEHLSPPTEPEKNFLAAIRAEPNERFACQVRVFGDVTIEVDYL